MFTSDDFSSVSLPELMAANNWQARYRLITQWGKLIQHKPELRLPENVIKGCEVSAWMAHKLENGVHRFSFDSDSRVINGLAVLLLAQVQGKTTSELSELDFAQFLSSLGLEKHLTPSRNNGLKAMISRVNRCIEPGL